MNKYSSLFILIFLFKTTLFAQTRLTIIGTAHEPTPHFNSDTLFDLLKKIKPDVILMELDTNLMDNQGNFKRWAINDVGNEHIASVRYRDIHPKVLFRPFDIAGRSVYYQNNNTFNKENSLFHSLDSLYGKKALSSQNMQIVADYYAVNDSLNKLYYERVYVLNSKMYMDLAARRQYGQYNKLLHVVATTPELSGWYDFFKDDADFWDVRNHAMINNILNYIKTFRSENIVVLTGAMHKYYLNDSLRSKQAAYHFKLVDFPE